MKVAVLLLLAASDPAGWISDRGGAVERDKQGNIVGVDLSGSWVTDTDLDRLTRFPISPPSTSRTRASPIKVCGV